MKDLQSNGIYDVTVKTKNGGKHKNKEVDTVHRAKFIEKQDEFIKFLIKPGADRPITWLVHPEAIVKTKKIRESKVNA
jgi:hypothetical protein